MDLIGQVVSEEKTFEICGHRRTDDGPWVSYKLTFGSGELKMSHVTRIGLTGYPTMSYCNRNLALQPQKMGAGLKCWISRPFEDYHSQHSPRQGVGMFDNEYMHVVRHAQAVAI